MYMYICKKLCMCFSHSSEGYAVYSQSLPPLPHAPVEVSARHLPGSSVLTGFTWVLSSARPSQLASSLHLAHGLGASISAAAIITEARGSDSQNASDQGGTSHKNFFQLSWAADEFALSDQSEARWTKMSDDRLL